MDCNGLEVCDTGRDACVDGVSTCGEGQSCDVDNDICTSTCAGCDINGSCIPNLKKSATNSCLICDVSESKTTWTINISASCDDGDNCTENDSCNASAECAGTAVQCNDAPGVCGANRSCNPANGQCTEEFPGNSTPCDDGDACTDFDRCDSNGGCSGTAKNCNDNLSCTADSCNGGVCENILSSTYCKISNTCFQSGTANPSNECQYCNPGSDSYSWSPKASTVKCTDDGSYCNGDEYCNGGGQCLGRGNPCTGVSGACAVSTCDETNNTCYRPNSYTCDTWDENQCASNACGGQVQVRTVEQKCSGSSATCNETLSTGSWRTADTCTANEACSNSTLQCEGALGCGNTYCQSTSGLCWTTFDSSIQYTQGNAEVYCSGLATGGATWHLPSVAEMNTLVEGPINGCYWPTEMGDCSDELWTSSPSQSFAFWVGTSAMWPSGTALYVRCVTAQ